MTKYVLATIVDDYEASTEYHCFESSLNKAEILTLVIAKIDGVKIKQHELRHAPYIAAYEAAYSDYIKFCYIEFDNDTGFTVNEDWWVDMLDLQTLDEWFNNNLESKE